MMGSTQDQNVFCYSSWTFFNVAGAVQWCMCDYNGAQSSGYIGAACYMWYGANTQEWARRCHRGFSLIGRELAMNRLAGVKGLALPNKMLWRFSGFILFLPHVSSPYQNVSPQRGKTGHGNVNNRETEQ